MKKLSIALFILAGLMALPAMAQDRAGSANTRQYQGQISPGEMTMTPEMWLYEQRRRDYLDPKLAVRRKAEFHADQRQRRLAAMKWFGYSNSRPSVSVDPMHGDWAPSWRSNNSYYPFRWQGVGHPWVVGRSQRPTTWVY